MIVQIIKQGIVFDEEICLFVKEKSYIEGDDIDQIKHTEIEMAKAMNFMSNDLKFTTETERDFANKRLPTLSFEIW